MNREKARKRFISPALCKAHTENMLDKIYDDFESRVCENCKEFKISKGFTGIEFTCYKGYGCTNEYGIIFTERTFGCNEFKRKKDDR